MVNDGVEAQMAIVDITRVPRDQVLLLEVIMPSSRRFCERIRDARFVLPPTETKET